MKNIAKKIAIGVIAAGSLFGVYKIGLNKGLDKGHEAGKQSVIGKMEKLLDINEENLKHNKRAYSIAAQYNDQPEEKERLKGLYKRDSTEHQTISNFARDVASSSEYQ